MSANQTLSDDIVKKQEDLKALLRGYGNVLVAYSGGVDSTYLADVAHEALGQNAWMVLADSPSLPRSEFKEAAELAHRKGWRFDVIHTDEFQNEEYLKNDGRRCYFCRSALFRKMKEFADANKAPVLAYGAMMDDTFDPTRLGTLAATEHKVTAPLQSVKLYKLEIRELSRSRGLSTSDKAAFACLSSRFPKGTRVTLEDLRKIEAAEETLKGAGFYQYRARHHGDICRIEIEAADLPRLLDTTVRTEIVNGIRALGYRFVTLDLGGYRMGSVAAK
jgi:uncharacterized protein